MYRPFFEQNKSEIITKPNHLKNKMAGVSLKKDKNGYFVMTHRARSKSYKTIDSIPDKDIKFIDSTG